MLGVNFGKCWPILKILSLLDCAINLQQHPCYIFPGTSFMSLRYLAKLLLRHVWVLLVFVGVIHSISLISLVFTSSSTCQPISHHPSLLQFFTPGSKPTFSTNPSHLLLPTGLPRDNSSGLDLSCASFFLFVPCGGLSWLLVSFLLHVEYTLSYLIVCPSWGNWNCSRGLQINATYYSDALLTGRACCAWHLWWVLYLASCETVLLNTKLVRRSAFWHGRDTLISPDLNLVEYRIYGEMQLAKVRDVNNWSSVSGMSWNKAWSVT